MAYKVLILGANGFIGSSLTRSILDQKDWVIYGMDTCTHKLGDCIDNERFKFVEGDITINREWIEYHVKKCDAIITLVAIANPAQYVADPLRVFELDFEANLEIFRLCVKYKKRLIHASTSEVYGMSADAELSEDSTSMTYGPIDKQRWIYACSKQLLDRVVYAYGVRDQLDYTLFRPFNWIGPNLDNVLEPKEGSSRLFTQFISNVLHGKPLKLVDGGRQSRSFTYIDDGIDCLLRIIENKGGAATRQIYNIGNPSNNVCVADLADRIVEAFSHYPDYWDIKDRVVIEDISSGEYFGKYYQDIQTRLPDIDNARVKLGWSPKVDLNEAISRTLEYYLKSPKQALVS